MEIFSSLKIVVCASASAFGYGLKLAPKLEGAAENVQLPVLWLSRFLAKTVRACPWGSPEYRHQLMDCECMARPHNLPPKIGLVECSRWPAHHVLLKLTTNKPEAYLDPHALWMISDPPAREQENYLLRFVLIRSDPYGTTPDHILGHRS